MAKDDAKKVIGQLLQMAAGNGIMGRAEPSQATSGPAEEAAEDPRYTPAYTAMGDGDYALAEEEFAELLKANPADTQAKIGKAQAGLLARVSRADADQVMAAVDQAKPSLDDLMAAADIDVAAGKPADGFDRLIAAIATAGPEDRELLRVRLLELFDTQDPADKAVLTARRSLTTALF